MAENYSLVLELENYQKFLDQANDIDTVIDKVGKSLDGLAGKFNKLDFGAIKFDTKSLEGLANIDLKGKSQSIAAIAKQYAVLGESVRTIDAGKITEVNKALSSGAKKETIEGKADALSKLIVELKKLEKVNLITLPTIMRDLFESLRATSGFDSQKLTDVQTAIGQLAKSMTKLNDVKINPDTVKGINQLSLSLSDLAGDQTIAKLTALTPQIKNLAGAFQLFGKDTKNFDASVLSTNLRTVTESLTTFLKLAKGFGAGFLNNGVENFKRMAEAVKELGKAFVEFKSPTDSFKNVEKNIAATVTALRNLKDEFAKFGSTTETVKTVAESFRAIGEAATALGSRTKSFEKLPDNIEKLNQALLNLNVKRLEEIAPTLLKVGPALQAMGNLATVTGKVFTHMSNEVKSSTSSFNYFTAIGAAIKTGFSGIVSVISTLVNAFKFLSPALISITKGFIALPFNVVVSGFKTLVSVISAPIRFLEFLGKATLSFAREMRLLEIGLNTVLIPFRLMQGVLTALGNAFNTFVNIIQKVVGFFDRFGSSSSKVKTELDAFGNVAESTKNKTSNLGTTLDSLDDKVTPVTNAFRQMGQSVDQSIDDSDTAKFVRFSSSLQAITTIGSAVMNTLRGISQGMQQMFSAGFEATAAFENVTKTLNVLSAGDMLRQSTDSTLTLQGAIDATSQSAKDLLDRYQMLGYQSIFSRQQLTDAHQLAQSLGFNITEAEELVKLTADWAAANGLSGDSIKSLILPLGQMRSLTKANTVDMKQLITAGNVPAFELLRAELERLTGEQVSMTKVQDLLSAGMIDSDTALRAVIAGFKTFEGAAASSTGTLSGLSNAFGDAKENIIRGFLTPILSSEEGLRDVFTNILSGDNIVAMTNAATQFGKSFAVYVVGAVNSAVSVFQTLIAIWRAIPGPIQESIIFGLKFAATTVAITTAIFAATAAISTLVAGFSLFVGAIPLATAAVAAFVTTLITNFDYVKNSFSQILYSFSEMRGVIQSVGKALQQTFNTGSFDPEVFSGLSSLSQSLASGLTSGLSSVGSALGSTFNYIVNWVGQFSDIAVQMYGFGVDTILSFVDGIWAGIGALVGAFQQIAGIFVTWFQPNSPPKVAPNIDTFGIETIATWVGGLIKGVQQYLPNLSSVIEPILQKVLQIFGGVGLFSVNVIITSITALTNVMFGLFQIMVGIGGAIVSEVALAISTAVKIISALIDPTLSFKDKFISVLNEIGFFITGTFVNIGFLLANSVSGIVTILNGLIVFIQGIFLSGLTGLAYAFPDTFSGVYASIVTFVQETSATLTDFVNNTSNSFVDLLISVTEYGYGLISSFADGIYAAINVVADALASMGDMITYWLAPGSPPNLLPDIDDWGTAAAQEFLDGFNEADIKVINDFGKTIEDTLSKLNVDGVNVEEVTRAFATGLDNLKKDGEFGADVMERIVSLTADAGPEVQSLTSKFKTLAEEQVKLNKTTEAYNAELKQAQGVLDNLNANEEIDANKNRIEALQNALTNTYLSTEERTEIQTKIDKLQATNKIKQLEQQKNAQEDSVKSVTESIDLQKQLLNISDSFDGSKQANAVKTVGDAAAKSAKTVQDKMTKLMLQQELAGKSTEEQIAVYKRYLSTLEEGSEEYVKTQTKIIELEARLEKEREAAAKKGEKRLGKAAQLAADYGAALAGGGNPFAKLSEGITKQTEKINNTMDGLVKKVQDSWKRLTGTFEFTRETGNIVPIDFNSLLTTVGSIGSLIGKLVYYIDIAVAAFDKFVVKNDVVRNALISLAAVLVAGGIVLKIKGIALAVGTLLTPFNLALTAVTLLGSAIFTFVQQSGGFAATISRIQSAWSGLTSSFSSSSGTGETSIDFSSFEGIANTIGSILGTAVNAVSTQFNAFYNSLSTAWQTSLTFLSNSITTTWQKFIGLFSSLNLDFSGLSRIKDFFSKNWIEIMAGIADIIIGVTLARWLLIVRGIALVLKNFTLPTDILTEVFVNFVNSINDYIITPVAEAFSSNSTLLGKLTAALRSFYVGVLTVLSTSVEGAFKRFGSGQFVANLEKFFDTTAIGKFIESNINESVKNIAPSLGKSFDLSTFIININQQFSNAVGVVVGFIDQIKQAFSTGVLANILKENSDAFNEFISEITSPEFIAAATTIGKSLAAVAAAVVTLGAALVDVAIIGILRNLADVFIVVGQGLDRIYAGFQLIISGNILGGVGELFGGIFDIVNGTFDVIGQTIADTVLAMVSFFSPEWAAKLEPVVSMVSKLIVQFFGWQAASAKVFSAIGGMFAKLFPWFSKTQKASQATGGVFKSFTNVLAPFRTAFTNIINSFKAAGAGLLKFGESVPFVRGTIQALLNVLNVLTKPIQFLLIGLKNLVASFLPVSSGVSTTSKVMLVLRNVATFLGEAFNTLVTFGKNLWTTILGMIPSVVSFVTAIGRGVATVVRFVDSIIGFLAQSTVLRAVLSWMSELFSGVSGLVRVVGQLLFSLGKNLINLGINTITALKPLETLKLLFSGLTNFATYLGTGLVKVSATLFAFGVTVYNAINSGIHAILEIDYVQQFIAWASGWVDAIWTGLSTFVTSLPEKIGSWTRALTEWLAPASPPKFLPDLAQWGIDIALVLLNAIVSAPLTALTTWGTNIGNAIINFNWLQFAGELGTKLSALLTSAVSTIVAIPTTIGNLINVTPDAEGAMAQNIKDALPNFDAVFGAGANEKISVGLADLISFNQAEITTATTYFKEFKDALDGFFNVKAVPEAFTTSLDTIISFFKGDVTFPETIKAVVTELGKVINFTAIPELFVTGLNSIITLFSENSTIVTVVEGIITALGQFATLIGIPESVVTSISNIFSFLSGTDVDPSSANAVAETLKQFGNLTGIPVSVKESLETVFGFFSENTTITTTIDAVAIALGKFNDLTGIGTGFAESFQAVFDLFSGEATFPQTVNAVSTALGNIVTTLNTTLGNPFAALDLTSFETTVSSINDILTNIYDAFSNLTTIDLSGISSAFEPLTSLFDSVGQQIENIKTGLSFIPGINLTGAEVEGTEAVASDVETSLQEAANNTEIPVETRIEVVTNQTNLSEQSAKTLTAFNDALETNATKVFGQTTSDNLTAALNTYLEAGFKPEDIKKLAEEAGVNVPAGFEEAFNAPENWAGVNSSAANQLLATFAEIKANLGIQSPSTVARDQIGLPIIQGIAEGLALTEGVDFVTPINAAMTAILGAAQTKILEISASLNLAASIFTLDEAVVAQTTQAINQFVLVFTTGFETVTTLLEETLEEWTEMLEEFFETVLDLADEFINAFVAKFEELKTKVTDKIRSLIAAIRAFATEFYEAGKSLASKLIEGFEDYLGEDGDGRSKLESVLTSLASAISASNKTLANVFLESGKTFGKPFVEGIAKGITEQTSNSALKLAVNALVEKIINIAKQAAGIKSPSRVAAAEIGVPITQGIGVGLLQGVTFVDDAVSSLMNSISLKNTAIGQSFTQGVVEGIYASTGLITNAVTDMANTGVNAARTALDIHSPSKVTERLIGNPFVQGIAKALVGGKSMLRPLTSDLLSVLPSNANFNLNVSDFEQLRLKEQSIDVRYNGLMQTLPSLSQDINLNRSQMSNLRALGLQHNVSTLITNRATQSFIQGMNRAYVNVAPHIAVMAEAQKKQLGERVGAIATPHHLAKQQTLANTSYMSDNRSTVVNNHNEYHMHISTTEARAARRVQKNFNSMRYGYRFR
jgi:hypothetical protein